MMKRVSFFILCLLPVWAWAQSQMGHVRTAGTPERKGSPLSGVMVRMPGRTAVLSDADGNFMLVTGCTEEGEGFSLSSVRKAGYELIDRQLIGRRFVYSHTVPIEIVMISTQELVKTRTAIEQRARRNAEARFKKRIGELEAQLKAQKISEADYYTQVQKLEKQMESFETLISAMADRYARTDYDVLDSLNAAINKCIVDGELDKADSLINTKGNVVERANRNMEKGARLHTARTKLDSIHRQVDSNAVRLQEEKHRIDRWKDDEKRVKEVKQKTSKSYGNEL